MSRIRTMIEVEYFNRQDAAVYLRAKLGPCFSWQKLLEHWAKSDRGEGLGGRGNLYLEPSAKAGRTPLYALEDLVEFVDSATEAIPGLGPQPLKPTRYVIDADALRYPVPWRLRRARSCTKKTAPPKH